MPATQAFRKNAAGLFTTAGNRPDFNNLTTPSNYTAFGVLGMPAGDLASKTAIKNIGCTHTVSVANWNGMQSGGVGAALNSTPVTNVTNDFDQAASVGLNVMLEFALQYPPAWVTAGANAVESFKDQSGNVYNDTSTSDGKGQQNWMWTSLGRTYVADFINKVAAALGPTRVAQCAAVKMGGGWYGELHYPPTTVVGSPYSWWGYGTSMQTGTGLASDQVVCPVPGYTIFSGNSTSDTLFINWYLNGLANWAKWFAATVRAAGFTCDIHVAHPGSGVRSNQAVSSAGYRQAAALGEDPATMIAAYAGVSYMWPYSTWLNNNDYNNQTAVAESDLSAFKKLYLESVKWGKHYKLWGENTGGENAATMAGMFSGNIHGSALSNAPWDSWNSPYATTGYQGMFWLNYTQLNDSNASHAQMADYATNIAAHQTGFSMFLVGSSIDPTNYSTYVAERAAVGLTGTVNGIASGTSLTDDYNNIPSIVGSSDPANPTEIQFVRYHGVPNVKSGYVNFRWCEFFFKPITGSTDARPCFLATTLPGAVVGVYDSDIHADFSDSANFPSELTVGATAGGNQVDFYRCRIWNTADGFNPHQNNMAAHACWVGKQLYISPAPARQASNDNPPYYNTHSDCVQIADGSNYLIEYCVLEAENDITPGYGIGNTVPDNGGVGSMYGWGVNGDGPWCNSAFMFNAKAGMRNIVFRHNRFRYGRSQVNVGPAGVMDGPTLTLDSNLYGRQVHSTNNLIVPSAFDNYIFYSGGLTLAQGGFNERYEDDNTLVNYKRGASA